MKIRTERLSTGYTIVRGAGPCNWTQVPQWPCSEEEIRKHAFPEASEDFILAASRLSEEIKEFQRDMDEDQMPGGFP
jgi:hypothetical protein